MRIFIAVTIPDDVKEKITALQQTLKRTVADVKWTEEKNFHLTLKFLGEVPDKDIDRISGAVEKPVRAGSPFTVCLAGAGAFPNVKNPRVLWVGVHDGVAELQRLAAGIDEVCAPLGFPKEKRAFAGHLTLGRVRSPQNREALGRKTVALREAAAGSFTVSSVEIMQSTLGPHGSHYTCLRSILLSTGTNSSSPSSS
jgi:2'-5' RNA ligase